MGDHQPRTGRQEEKDKQVVVSVRFPERLFQRIQAYAAVLESTANAVVREGMEDYIRRQVQTPQFRKASQQHVERAQAEVAALEEVATAEAV